MNHIYILYSILFMFIVTIIYLHKKKYKETFTDLTYEQIQQKFKSLYENTIKSKYDKTINIKGGVFTNGKTNLPTGWSGGLRTVDLYASGTIIIGNDNITSYSITINNNGSATFANDLVQFTPDGLYIYNKNDRKQYARLYVHENTNIYLDMQCSLGYRNLLAIQTDNNVCIGYLNQNKCINQFRYN